MNYDELVEKIESDVTFRAVTQNTCIDNFDTYLTTVFYLVNSSNFFYKGFHRTVIRKLQALVDGEAERRNLGICVPVGSGKSLIVEYFITWCFARTINNAFCYVSHSDRLINRLSKEVKDIIEHPLWILLFGNKLKKDDRQRINFSFDGAKNRTGLTAGTMGGGLTGLDAGNPNVPGFSGALIIDDPLDIGESFYEVARETCFRHYDDKLATRRRTPTTPTIVIMQRAHQEDLIGRVKETQAEDWEIIEIPAVENGESFWPERYPLDELMAIKEHNPYKFFSQYQQTPIIVGGSIIKKDWWKFYDPEVERKEKTLTQWAIALTGDTAFKTGDANDYSAFQAWCFTPDRLLLLDGIYGKWEFHELQERAKEFYKKWAMLQPQRRIEFYIEDKASGTPLCQVLNEGGVMATPWLPREYNFPDDKVSRMNACAYAVYAGHVFLPEGHPYSTVLIDEAAAFSRNDTHSYDDNCDSFTIAVSVWKWLGGNIA